MAAPLNSIDNRDSHVQGFHHSHSRRGSPVKKIEVLLVVFAVLAAGIIGCSSTPTTPQAKPTVKKDDTTTVKKDDTTTVKKDDTTTVKKELVFKMPADAKITQGKETTVEISVIRDDKHVDGAVKLKLSDLPTGVTASDAEIAKDKDKATVTLKAAADAKDGEAKVTVTGESGDHKATTTFKLTVDKKGPPNP
jgi:hypothetical protein